MSNETTTPAHTAGPWIVEPFRFGAIPQGHQIIGAKSGTGNDTYLAVVHCGTQQVTQGEGEANAQLIASAPDLLEACKGMLLWAQRVNGKNTGPEVMQAVTAIAKATSLSA